MKEFTALIGLVCGISGTLLLLLGLSNVSIGITESFILLLVTVIFLLFMSIARAVTLAEANGDAHWLSVGIMLDIALGCVAVIVGVASLIGQGLPLIVPALMNALGWGLLLTVKTVAIPEKSKDPA